MSRMSSSAIFDGKPITVYHQSRGVVIKRVDS